MRKRMAALLAVVMTGSLYACGESTAESSSDSGTVPEEQQLVILGDSISVGYGLDEPETMCYAAKLEQMLNETEDALWTAYNYAVSGDTSTDLLKRLEDGRAVRLPSAERIVVGIGSNNMLGPYSEYCSAALRDIATPAQQAEAFSALQTALDAGKETLEADLETMYTKIRSLNADATIYLLDLYHPYAEVTATIDGTQTVADFGAKQLAQYNQVLTNFANSKDDVRLVEIAAVFAETKPLPVQGKASDGLLLDPHPTEQGQDLIADALAKAMKSEP